LVFVFLLGMGIELLKFIKWYIAIRRRVSSNVLSIITSEINTYEQEKILALDTDKEYDDALNQYAKNNNSAVAPPF